MSLLIYVFGFIINFDNAEKQVVQFQYLHQDPLTKFSPLSLSPF